MKGFESGNSSFQENAEPVRRFNPESLARTTIARAMRAAEMKYGHNRFQLMDEVTDSEGNLESIILVDPQQAVDSSVPQKLVRMRRTDEGRWESDEFLPE
jgi:hypothetical protein